MKKRKADQEDNTEQLKEGDVKKEPESYAVNDWVKSEQEWVKLCKQPEFNWKDHQFSTPMQKANDNTMKVLREVHLGKMHCQLDSLLKRPRLERCQSSVKEKANLVHYPTVHQLQHLQNFEVLLPERVPPEWVLGATSDVKKEDDSSRRTNNDECSDNNISIER